MTNTPWLIDNHAAPDRHAARLRAPAGGQLSSYKVESKDTVASLKAKVAATAIARRSKGNRGRRRALHGRELGDDETRRRRPGVAGRAMLVRPGRARVRGRAEGHLVEAAKAPASDRSAGAPRVNRSAASTSTTAGPWHYRVAKPYAMYKQPVDGVSQYQSAEYELREATRPGAATGATTARATRPS